MSNKIIIKKSSVNAKIPLPTDLEYGELALNYNDGILYYKNTNNLINPLNTAPLYTKYDRKSYITNGTLTYDVSYALGNNGTNPYVEVYLNGLLLTKGTDYTATTGQNIVLVQTPANGSKLECIGYKDFQIFDLGITGSGITFNTTTGYLDVNSSVTDTANSLVLRDSVGSITGQTFLINKGNGTYGSIGWNSTDATYDMGLDNGVVLQAGQELHYYGRAVGAIANGDVVMFAGVQGDNLLITKADASAVGFQAKWIMGIATQTIANNAWGYVTSYGKVSGINTTAYSAGAILYFDSANPGKLTTTEPIAPNPKVTMAAVLRSANDGILLVRPDCSHKLDNLQNVNINGVTNNDFLIFDNNTSTWKNTSELTQITFDNNTNYINKTTGTLDSLTYVNSASAFSTEARDLYITSNGTTIFVLDNATDSIIKLSLSTAWDLTTTSNTGITFSIAAQTTLPYGLTFSDDGTKMYVSGFNVSGFIYQYDLSTPWDISTAVYFNSYNTTWTTSGIHGLRFNSTGTKLFGVDNANDIIYQHNLSTPWNITSITLGPSIAITNYATGAQGLDFNDDGSKLYILDPDNRKIVEFTLTTPYDLTTWLYTNTISINHIVYSQLAGNAYILSGASGLMIYGNKFFICDYNSDVIILFTVDKSILNIASNKTVFQNDTSFKSPVRVNSALTADIIRARSTEIYGLASFTSTASFSSSVSMTTTTGSINMATSMTTGAVNIGGTSQTGVIAIGGSSATGALTFGRSTSTQIVNIGTGATLSGNTKTINIGTNGLLGSTTSINVGSNTSSTSVNINGSLSSNIIKQPQGNITATTASTTLDFNSYGNFYINLTTNTALVFNNLAANIGSSGYIFIKENATGGYTFSLPGECKTPGGRTITQTTTANSLSLITFYVVDASTVIVNYIPDFK